jgi:hypothetical protein
MRPVVPLLVALALAGCGGGPCNGSSSLCARRYDQVVFAATHNSFASKEDKVADADQTWRVPRQLADGVRALHLEVFPFDFGKPWVCHALCQLGGVPMVDALADVRVFLDGNPREVVTLMVELNRVTTAQVAQAFMDSGLIKYVRAQGPPWPPLADLIDGGERVVVLADTVDAAYPWLLDRWKLTWETPWQTYEPWTFSCALDRGTAGAALYTVDHFLDNPFSDIVPSPARAELVNHDPFFVERVELCRMQAGQLPNFVLVNFYEIGDLLHVVAALNGLEPALPLDYDLLPTADLEALPDGSAGN